LLIGQNLPSEGSRRKEGDRKMQHYKVEKYLYDFQQVPCEVCKFFGHDKRGAEVRLREFGKQSRLIDVCREHFNELRNAGEIER
jgi:hypothetical protein